MSAKLILPRTLGPQITRTNRLFFERNSPSKIRPHPDRRREHEKRPERLFARKLDDRERYHFQAGGTACGDVSCDQTTALGSACDGEGACVEQAPVSCEPYACGNAGCLTSCNDDTDCSTGNSCMDGSCVFTGGRCSEDRTNPLDGDGNLVEECTPYFCVNGRCEDACISTSDCQDGFLCDTAQSRCVSGAENEATSEGCGCRVKTNQSGTGFALAYFFLALAIGVRRRRRTFALTTNHDLSRSNSRLRIRA